MGGLSDLNTLLEKIPVWKRLVSLPAEMDALRARIAVLEEKLGRPLSKDACPRCGERAFFVETSRPSLSHMGKEGRVDRMYACRSCGHREQRKNMLPT